jgi:hypothetical protein
LEDQLAASKRAEDMAVVQFGYSSQEAEKARQVTRETADKVAQSHKEYTAMIERGNIAHDFTLRQGNTLTYNSGLERDRVASANEKNAANRALASEHNADVRAAIADLTSAEQHLTNTRKGGGTDDDIKMAQGGYDRARARYESYLGRNPGTRGTDSTSVVGSFTPGVNGAPGKLNRHQ